MRSRTVLPGRPQARLQAVCTGQWARRRLIAYVSGNTLVIMGGVDEVLQTIYCEGILELSAVDLDERTGKFAVGAGNQVSVYCPVGMEAGDLKWTLQSSFSLNPDDGDVRSLSWGSDDEVLVGSNSLSLWETSAGKLRTLWRKPLPNPIRLAVFSYDATLVASVGEHDRLVKVWERLSFGSEDVQFGFTYLSHPRAVTNIYWRTPFHREETIESVLYTICVDSVLRIWAPRQGQDQGGLQLWAEINLQETVPAPFTESSIDPEIVSAQEKIEPTPPHYALIIDSRVLKGATEFAMSTAGNSEKQIENKYRLTEIASRNPEICVVFDTTGRMSALGIDNIDTKQKKPSNFFYIVTGESSELVTGLRGTPGEQYLHFLAFSCVKQDSGGLVVLAHSFDGRIYWFDARLDELLDPAPRKNRLRLRGVWSGHSSSITGLVRTAHGRALLSSTEAGEHSVWTRQKTRDSVMLMKQSEVHPPEKVQRAIVMDTGRLVMTLHEGYVILWDTSNSVAIEVDRCHYYLEGKVLSLLLLPEADDGISTYHIVAVTSKMRGVAWEVTVKETKSLHGANGVGGPKIRQYALFDLGETEEHHMLLAVDPVGWTATLTGSLDRFSREVATSISPTGLLRSWSARVSPATEEVNWLALWAVETGIKSASLIRGSSLGKVAIVSSERYDLTIWATRSAQLEYQMLFEKCDTVRDLDWACTPDSQSILAVGFTHKVVLLSQLRYDYLHKGPSWAPFREVKIQNFTPHSIGDSIWLEDGALAIAAGNQIYLHTRNIENEEEMTKSLNLLAHRGSNTDIYDIVSHLNGPVPVYHPQFLQQCILAGRTKLVERILVNLHKELRSYHEEIPLELLLNIPQEVFLDPEHGDGEPVSLHRRYSKVGTDFANYTQEDDFSTFSETMAKSLCEYLTKIPIPHLTGSEQMGLAGIIECAAQVSRHRRSIDENGARYLLFFRQWILRQKRLRVPVARNEGGLSWREIVWAFHSVSQEILVDLVSRPHKGKMMWNGARESGLFMWLKDLESVRNQWEIIARNHYTQNEEKNPIDCSLHYLALHKKNVLVGLWRIAHMNREQGSTYKFLSNDFTNPRWKTAAKKNAFALLGKQRYEYAAAFFLLADALKDCVNVCFTQLKDPQLAIAVARVYEGDDGPVLKGLLKDKVLPLAVAEGNRWMATWAYWMLKRRDLAVRAIVSRLDMLLPSNSPRSPAAEIESHSYLTDDPALIILYKLLRDKTTQTLRGLEQISPAAEFEFVLHTARLYDRMGCDILALELVKNWEFLNKFDDMPGMGVRRHKTIDYMHGRRHRRRSSVTVTDEVLHSFQFKGGMGEDFGAKGGVSVEGGTVGGGFGLGAGARAKTALVKPPASVFQEPDMSWAFG